MKIEIKVGQSADYGENHKVIIDGVTKHCIYPLCECPEDAMIGRSLIDGFQILEAIRMGYEAAKRGEELIVETIEEKDED